MTGMRVIKRSEYEGKKSLEVWGHGSDIIKARLRTIKMAAIMNRGETVEENLRNCLRQGVLNWGNFAPRDIWQCLEILLFVTLEVCATGI